MHKIIRQSFVFENSSQGQSQSSTSSPHPESTNTSIQTEENFSDPIMKRRVLRSPSRDIVSLLIETGVAFEETSQFQTNESLTKDKVNSNTNAQTTNNQRKEQNDEKLSFLELSSSKSDERASGSQSIESQFNSFLEGD
jgi:hypothetical protein